ncbi:MAG: Zn-ribbon domain-containing OB-fold protein [Chloroflexi bacterium]|nr:Zn-ribbon domain-containing OB-fold protein [Chloroflexota bacterium]
MSAEKVTQLSQTKRMFGELSFGPQDVKLYGQYTYGIAGERFFREIKDNGRIMGTRCQKCQLVYLPPRIYCERCFAELKEWVEVEGKGRVHSYTAVHVDLDGNRLNEPILMAIVEFPGIYGGFVHKLGEIEPRDVRIGLKVEVVLKREEEREGSILDIEYFKPGMFD